MGTKREKNKENREKTVWEKAKIQNQGMIVDRWKQPRSLAQTQVFGFHRVRKHRLIKKGKENRVPETFSGEKLGTGQLT